MLTRNEVLECKKLIKSGYDVASDTTLELCDYWLEQNKKKKIEKVSSLPLYDTTAQVIITNKLNEIIDVINEMRVGK